MSDTSGSIYEWIGSSGVNSDNPNSADSWQLVSGPGNADGRPGYPGDGAIVPGGGSALPLSDAEPLDNTIDIQGGVVDFTGGALLGPVTLLQISSGLAAGDVISFTIAAPGDATPFTVSYTVTSADTQGDELSNLADDLGGILHGTQAAAALGIYLLTGAGPDGSLAIGSFSGVAPSVAASTGISVLGTYAATTLTDSGGTNASFNALGTVYNGGIITAGAPGGHFVITTSSDSAGNAGDFVNLNQILVTSGDNLLLSAGDGASQIDNFGTIDVTSGTLTIDAPFANDQGIIEVASGGRVQIDSTLGTRQHVVFDTANPGGVLEIDAGALTGTSFAPKVIGFAAGDEIYLPGITYNSATDTVSYTGGDLDVYSGSTLLVAISLQTGDYTTSGFSLGAGGNGGLDIYTTATAAHWVGGTSTDWNAETNWSTSSVPDSNNIAVVVDSEAQTSSLVTSGAALNINSLELDDPNAFTLDVESDLTIKRALINLGNNVSLSAGTLSASSYQQIGPATSLSVTGGVLDLSGGASGTSAGNTGLVLGGTSLITGGAIEAAGYAAIGVGAQSGNVTVQAGSVAVTYTILGSTALGGGTLTLTGAGTSWTDTASDTSVAVLYGTTRPGLELGVGNSDSANGNSNPAYLLVTNSASLTDDGAVVIGTNPAGSFGGQGIANVASGGTWTINSGADLIVGVDSGVGVLDVVSGGQVILNGGGNVIAGGPDGGSGFITVNGSGAVISTTGELTIGNGGSGSFDVTSGGSAAVGGIYIDGTNQSLAEVYGSGAVLSADGNVTLANGGALQDYGLSIAASGTFTPIEGGAIVIGGGTASAGSIIVASGFAISGAGFVDGVPNIDVSSAVIDDGTIAATVSGQTLAVQGNLLGSGVLTIANGATLELAGNDGSVPGGIAPSVVFSGASGTLALTTPGSMFGAIENFGGTNQIDLAGQSYHPFSASALGFNYSGNLLEVTSGGNFIASLDIGSGYGGDVFSATADGSYGAFITESVPCYCRGTRILTDRGEVAVEDLVIGTNLITATGAARPLRWIGKRAYAGRFAARNRDVLPIVIRQGALSDGVPRRDLYVSPLHALFLDGVLIPARALVNGGSIAQMRAVEMVEYFHLELETHDVILADGAPAESYLDDRNRGMFHNAADYHTRYPDAHGAEPRYCATRVEAGAQVAALRDHLAQRGLLIGYDPPGSITATLTKGTNQVLIPEDIGELRLISDYGHAPGDARRLGALIMKITLDGAAVDLGDTRLAYGFHAVEAHPAHKVRWTDGEAVIELDAQPVPRWIAIEVTDMGSQRPAAQVS